MEEELSLFCHTEYPRLVGALSLYCGDRWLAEELAQESMVRVVRDWSKVRNLAAPGAWAHRAAINLANSHFRRTVAERRARHRMAARDNLIQENPDTPTALAVRDALASLPKRQRAVIVLRFFADLSVREVADLLDCPEGTVKSFTARALRGLRTAGLNELKEAARAV